MTVLLFVEKQTHKFVLTFLDIVVFHKMSEKKQRFLRS